jgi:uncharacterized protein
MLTPTQHLGKEMLRLELTPVLMLAGRFSKEGILNNLLVTTDCLRRYHYEKQKNNGFYHIQAINLPFQNIEYYWSH